MHQSGKDSKTFGEPDEWEFDYPWEVVQTAFWLWSMSGFQRLPTQDEVMSYDPRFVSDLRLAHQIYAHQGNTSVPMRLFENWEAFQSDPHGFRAQQEFQNRTDQNDAAPRTGISQLFARNQNGSNSPRNGGNMVNVNRMKRQ